jgi:hypothetical protein
MSPSPGQDFAPKILVVGRQNELISILLEIVLKEEQSRFGVRSAGVEPSGRLHPGMKQFLGEYESDDVQPEDLRSTPISVALDDHVQLVAFTEPSVREEGPIIATTGDKITLETGTLRKELSESPNLDRFRAALDELRTTAGEEILETMGLD